MPWRDLTKLDRGTFAPGAFKGTARVAYTRVAPMVILAAVIFVADTVTRLEIAVAVFYVAVVLLAIGHFQARGVIVVSGACMALTVISYFLSPTESESGAINCLIGLVAIVITARLGLRTIAAMVEVHEAQARLAHIARVTSLGELTASIAHEVNQPLAAIMTSADTSLRWLAAQPPNFARARTAIERIVSDASRATDVISRVRRLARREPPRKELGDLNEIVTETTALMRAQIDKHRVSLRTELSESLPPVLMDKIQIQQVILNLLLNAVEALRAVDGPRPRHLVVRSRQEGAKSVIISVEDNAFGIAPDQLDHVFDAFHSTKQEGLGIGLTISRSILAAHGGRIWAENAPANGAVFQFSVPTQEPDEP